MTFVHTPKHTSVVGTSIAFIFCIAGSSSWCTYREQLDLAIACTPVLQAMSAKSNPLLYTSQKLSGEWSAANFAANLDSEMADKLFDEWPKLDTGVRMRILLSTLFMTQQQRDNLRDPVHRLIDRASAHQHAVVMLNVTPTCTVGSGEEDDWVKVMAHAVHQLNGQLDLPAVARSARDVDTGLVALTAQMQAERPTGYAPLETPFLNTRCVWVVCVCCV